MQPEEVMGMLKIGAIVSLDAYDRGLLDIMAAVYQEFSYLDEWHIGNRMFIRLPIDETNNIADLIH